MRGSPARRCSRFILLLLACSWLAAAQSADVGVTKLGADLAPANTDVAYTLTVTNAGPDPAANFTLTDPIPAGMTFVSLASPAGFACVTPAVGANGTVSCSIATLTPSQAVFTLTVHIPAGTPGGTSFTNIATVATTTADPNSENDSGTAATFVPAPSADLGVMKTAPDAAPPGTDLPYSISVVNGGPNPGVSVSLTDALPGTMTFLSLVQNSGPAFVCSTPAVGANGTITCSIASLAAGGSATFTLVGHIPGAESSGTTFTNIATIASTTADPNSENDVSTISTIVSSADVSVSKIATASVTVGNNITYNFTVTNSGPDQAHAVSLNDALPPGTTFVSFAKNTGPSFACSTPVAGATGSIGCSASTLNSGASATFTLIVKTADSTAGSTISNTATVAASTGDPNIANNSSTANTVVPGVADLAVNKTASSPGAPGGTIHYTVTVSNNGPTAAANVSLSDVIPPNTTFVSLTQTGAPTFACTTPASGGSGTATCTVATFNSGAAATFTLVVRVAADVAEGTVITNTATVSSSTSDPNSANNTATASTTVRRGSAFSVPAISPFAYLILFVILTMVACRALRSRTQV